VGLVIDATESYLNPKNEKQYAQNLRIIDSSLNYVEDE
jgi:hypothetical protein